MKPTLIDKHQALLIAHRGLSGLETENTVAAFVAAGNRSYVGIETDVHKTADGHFVLIHDDTTARVAGVELTVEDATLDELNAVQLFQKDGNKGRRDLVIPLMEDYFSVCKTYDKTAVFELKNRFADEDIAEILRRIDAMGMLDNTIFISFVYENLLAVKARHPSQTVQFLTGGRDDMDWLIDELARHDMGIDVYWPVVTDAFVKRCHERGVKVNCWTVDDPDVAAKLIACGVDYITTNILE